MTQENLRIRITKRMLKDGLIQLLRTKSIHKISIKEICEEAQVHRTTFYKYYGSQYDLLFDMENDVLNLIDNYLISGNGCGNIPQLLLELMKFVDENTDLCRLLLSNTVDPEFPSKLFALQSLQELLRKQSPPAYHQGDQLEYVFAFVINGILGIIRKWLREEGPRESPREIALLLDRFIMKLRT